MFSKIAELGEYGEENDDKLDKIKILEENISSPLYCYQYKSVLQIYSYNMHLQYHQL